MLMTIFEKSSIKVTFFNKSSLTAQFQPFFSPEGQKFLKKDDKRQKSKFFYHEAHKGTRRFNKN